MEVAPRYNFNDVLWAPARALSAKQIGVMTLSLIVALMLYNLFSYLAYFAQGDDLGVIYSAYGLFPFEPWAYESSAAMVIYTAGIVVTIFVVMLGFFGVSAINVEQLRGNRFFSFGQSINFARRRAGQIFLAECAIILFVLFIVALFLLLGLATRIPRVGEWLYALLFFFPNFFIAIFAVFIIFVLPTTVFLLPSVAASERNGEVFSVILECFSTIIRTPIRWSIYTLYGLVVAKVASFIYFYFCYRAVQFTTIATSLAGSPKPEFLVRAGLYHLPVRADLIEQMANVFPGVHFGFQVPFYPVYNAYQPVAYVMTAMLFLVLASVFGYALATVAAAETSAYIALRYVKDGHKVPEEKSLFAEARE